MKSKPDTALHGLGGALEVDVLLLKKGALIIRAINHPLRQHMLQVIHQNTGLTVTELYTKLRLEQSVASQHLAVLRQAGCVLTERQGKHIFYYVHVERLQQLHQLSRALVS